MENLGTYEIGDPASLIIPLHSFDTGALFAGSAVARIFRASDMVQVGGTLEFEPFPDSETPEQGKYFITIDTSSLNPGSHLLLIDAVADAVPVSRCYSFYMCKKKVNIFFDSDRPYMTEEPWNITLYRDNFTMFKQVFRVLPHIIKHDVIINVPGNAIRWAGDMYLENTIIEEGSEIFITSDLINVYPAANPKVELKNVFGKFRILEDFPIGEYLRYFERTVEKTDYWHNVGEPGEPAYLNGFSRMNLSQNNPGFFKSSDNIVFLKGMVKGGGQGLDIFILPEDYRPEYTCYLPGNFSSVFGSIEVRHDGGVRPLQKSNNWYCLDGLSFPAKDLV